MGLTILEVLQGEESRSKRFAAKNESLKVMYDLVLKHQVEIEEARNRGYSWTQIDNACRVSWQEQDNFAVSIAWWKSRHFIESLYRAIKNGTTVGEPNPANKPAKKKAKPLSLKVTVEKR